MANNYFGTGIITSANFDIGVQKPIDSRFTVQKFDGLKELHEAGCVYKGLIVYDETDKIYYQYTGDPGASSPWTKIDILNLVKDFENLVEISPGTALGELAFKNKVGLLDLGSSVIDHLNKKLTADSIQTGVTNGTIKVESKEVAVAGLGTAAYKNVEDFGSGVKATYNSDTKTLTLTF